MGEGKELLEDKVWNEARERQDGSGRPAWSGLPRGKLGGGTGEGWDRGRRGDRRLEPCTCCGGRISSRTQEADPLGWWDVASGGVGLNRGKEMVPPEQGLRGASEGQTQAGGKRLRVQEGQQAGGTEEVVRELEGGKRGRGPSSMRLLRRGS